MNIFRPTLAFIFILVIVNTININEIQAQKIYPTATLKNDALDVTIAIPDKIHGYYRSTRFDWSGIIAQVKYGKHTYFKDWNTQTHIPSKPGAATGTAEEFRTPLGYKDAKIGGKFVKIGVGILERATNDPYHWEYPYKIIESGKWDIKQFDDRVRFSQNLTTDFGYAYHYTKTIILNKNSSKVTVTHTLKNMGSKKIETNPYCHNFFKFDNDVIGNNYTLTFPNSIIAKTDFGSNANFSNNTLSINKISGTSVIQGIIDTNRAKTFTLTNSKKLTSVTINYDVVPDFFYLYIWNIAYCPEPMVFINIESGESFDWSFNYDFKQ